MSNYRKNYRVILVNKNTLEEEGYAGLSLSEAKKIAKEESLKNNQNVFIYAGIRQSDGQELYYNRDGFNCTGKAW